VHAGLVSRVIEHNMNCFTMYLVVGFLVAITSNAALSRAPAKGKGTCLGRKFDSKQDCIRRCCTWVVHANVVHVRCDGQCNKHKCSEIGEHCKEIGQKWWCWFCEKKTTKNVAKMR
jgi:hypothetical protein